MRYDQDKRWVLVNGASEWPLYEWVDHLITRWVCPIGHWQATLVSTQSPDDLSPIARGEIDDRLKLVGLSIFNYARAAFSNIYLLSRLVYVPTSNIV